MKFFPKPKKIIPVRSWKKALDPNTGQEITNLIVSSLGEIKRTRRQIAIKSGDVRTYKERTLKRTKHKTGYKTVLGILVHRLVFTSFTGEKMEPGYVVHHKDNDRSNNRIDNLEKIT